MEYSRWIVQKVGVLRNPNHSKILPSEVFSSILVADAAYKESKRLYGADDRYSQYCAKILYDTAISMMKELQKDLKTATLTGACGHTCYLCGKHLDWREAHLDHVFPRAFWRRKMGKTVTRGNIMPTHKICGDKKADTMPTKELIDKARETYKIAGIAFYDEGKNKNEIDW